jgi:phosphatidylglycerol---prolipoprotein diacylglyceryl transferase
MNFLHNLHPNPIIATFGPVNFFWYGLLVVLGIMAGLMVTVRLAKKQDIDQETIFDLAFYTIIFSIIGARLYDVLLELPYYIDHPLDIFKIWQGGLAIHGALIAGIITVWYYAKKKHLSSLLLAALMTPGLALGQAIGRWGNYFNQELFGKPTTSNWGIPIDTLHRPVQFFTNEYFLPTFLFESLGDLAIFLILLWLYKKNHEKPSRLIILLPAYLIMYSLLRFLLEFIRIDTTPTFIGLRWPQIISLIIVLASLVFYYHLRKKHPKMSGMRNT